MLPTERNGNWANEEQNGKLIFIFYVFEPCAHVLPILKS